MAEVPTGIPNGDHLSVGRRVIARSDPIVSPTDDFSIFHDDRPEGTSLAVPHSVKGKADGFPHVFFVHLFREVRV